MALAFAGLAATRQYSYLLFHTLAELYSIIIAATYFVIAWTTRNMNQDRSIAALGVSYLFIAVLDLFHTLGFAGMNLFPGYAYPANQLWVIGRFLEAGSLLSFSFLHSRSRWLLPGILVLGGAYSAAGLASVFVFRNFPACFVAGLGQTPFKVAAEAGIILALGAAAIVLVSRRRLYSSRIFRYLFWSIILTLISELTFALYLTNYDWLNMVGHLLKIASFYLVYRSIILTGLERPQEVVYSELSRRAEDLQRANHAKNSLLSILSHDLRGPLSGIRGASELLLEDDRFDRSEERDSFLREIGKTAGGALDLVEQVLSWARMQGEDLVPHIERIDLGSVLDEQTNLLEESAHGKGIKIERPPGEERLDADSDRDMLGAIARNLLSNAIKFTPRGGSIRVSAGRRGESLVISVRDTGVGLTEDARARLFQVDRRLRGLGTEGERGSGFGLVLSSEFAERLGGRIEVDSEPGRGSEFRLILPG